MGANDDTVGATRSVGWEGEGLNASDGVAARTKARAAAEIPADLMAFLGSGGTKFGRAELWFATDRPQKTYVRIRTGRASHTACLQVPVGRAEFPIDTVVDLHVDL